MLPILRKIRKSFIDSGATRKYLLYAVGEIALVVIGILIALQINNWNEWRKEREKERKILVGVASDLERNCKILADLMEFNDICNRSADLIISLIHGNQVHVDSLSTHLHLARIESTLNLSVSEAGYEALKNAGFDIVQTDTLKDAILSLYETSYPSLMKFAEMFEDGRTERYKFINQHFITEYGGRLTAIEMDKLLDDINYFVFLKRLQQDRHAIHNRSESRLQETQKVLQLIKDELGDSD